MTSVDDNEYIMNNRKVPNLVEIYNLESNSIIANDFSNAFSDLPSNTNSWSFYEFLTKYYLIGLIGINDVIEPNSNIYH